MIKLSQRHAAKIATIAIALMLYVLATPRDISAQDRNALIAGLRFKADYLTPADNGQPMDAYYIARCGIDTMHFVNVPAKFRLIPGMTLEADLCIIGGGFTGSLLYIHLLREAPPDTRLYLFDRSGCFGSGLAYGTKHAGHLLNVPAGRMSAFPDRPRDFLTWLERQPCHVLAGVAPAENAFVPRHLYGAYMRDLLLDARCGAAADRLILQRDGVVAIEDDGSRLTLRLFSGGSLRVDAAVMAGGNIPASW